MVSEVNWSSNKEERQLVKWLFRGFGHFFNLSLNSGSVSQRNDAVSTNLLNFKSPRFFLKNRIQELPDALGVNLELVGVLLFLGLEALLLVLRGPHLLLPLLGKLLKKNQTFFFLMPS